MKIIDWLGSLMVLVAIFEFVPNPKKAISSIPDVLATNVHMSGNHLVLQHLKKEKREKTK